MKIKVPIAAMQPKPFEPAAKPPAKGPAAILGNPLLRKIAIGLATVLVILLVLNAGIIGNQQKVENKELGVKSADLQARLDALQVEKTRVEESLLQVTLEKEQLKNEQAQQLAAIARANATAQAALLQDARTLSKILSSKWYDPAVLDATRQNYVQWDLYACQYYLGVYVFTSGGNVTVPIGCVLWNAAYVNSSKFIVDQISNASNSPAKLALDELKAKYPDLEK